MARALHHAYSVLGSRAEDADDLSQRTRRAQRKRPANQVPSSFFAARGPGWQGVLGDLSALRERSPRSQREAGILRYSATPPPSATRVNPSRNAGWRRASK